MNCNLIKKRPTTYSITKSCILLGLFATLFLIGTFLDFQVSQGLYASNKELHGKIGSFITDVLLNLSFNAMISCMCAFAFSSFVFKKDKLWITILVNIIIWVLLAIDFGKSLSGWNNWSNVLGREGSIAFNTIFMTILAAGSVVFGYFGFRHLNQRLVFKVTFWFIITCMIASYSRLFLSYLASRPRPRLIFDAEKPQEAFVPWYRFNPFNCFKQKNRFFYQSFPSGHSCETFFFLGFAAVLYRVKMIKSWKLANMTFGLLFIVAALVPFGRMLGGWHYLSDVSMGVMMSIASFFGMSFLLTKRVALEKKIL